MIVLRETAVGAEPSPLSPSTLSEAARARLDADPLAREWLARAPAADAAPPRHAQWAASRQALADALEQGQVDAPGSSAAAISLAHTARRALAAVRFGAPGAGLGVDIEELAREISPSVIARILSPEEIPVCEGFAPHAIWVIKEAAFKAMPARLQGPISGVRIGALERNDSGVSARIIAPAPARVQAWASDEYWLAVAEGA